MFFEQCFFCAYKHGYLQHQTGKPKTVVRVGEDCKQTKDSMDFMKINFSTDDMYDIAKQSSFVFHNTKKDIKIYAICIENNLKAIAQVLDGIFDSPIDQVFDKYKEKSIETRKSVWYEIPQEKSVSFVSTYQMCQIKTEKLKELEELYNEYILQKNMPYTTLLQDCQKLLLQKHQIILTGAPGTGKTYLARAIAQDMVGKGNENLQTTFVQFHPSYDYTDFVEGLRPVQKEKGDNKEIGFELKNGAFKEFCRVAGVVERACAGNLITPLTKERLGELLGGNDEAITFWKKYESNFQKWYEALKKWYDNPKEAYPYEALSNLPKFVFIIDEVNRAEISKVFGELMFSIDEGYRGIAGKVKTQYANIQTDATFFTDKANDYFFVPSNVYIIGTMNDIDRSVETFDFAMRRRFAWLEVKVTDTQDSILANLPEAEEAKKRLGKLNEAIEKIEGLNRSYHIGASYFGKLKNDNSFDNLWTYHLEPLLREYLRGLPKAEDKLKELENAYKQS